MGRGGEAVERGIETSVLAPAGGDGRARHCRAIKDYLYDDISEPPAHEYGMRPSRESLAEVGRYLDERLSSAMTSLARGRLEERLRPRFSLAGPLLDRLGGGHRVAMCVVGVLLIWALVSGL